MTKPSDDKQGSKAQAGERAAAHQRELQAQQNRKDAAEPKDGGKSSGKDKPPPAVQAGARAEPAELHAPLQDKPGHEAELPVRPQFMAPDYKGSGKLEGHVALITGGDSGIGRAVAVLFAREGADVAIVYLNEHEDAAETRHCVENEGQRCFTLAGDVKDEAFCKDAVEQTVKVLGKLDVLVNNAAFQEHAKSLEDLTAERIDETFHTNIRGYFFMAKAALKHLQRGAAIINTGSVTGLEGSAQLLDYSATKGAIHAFTKSLAKNLMDKGIRVNAVAPGPVWTPLNPSDGPQDKIDGFGQQTEMKRAAQPEELSPAYVFLASPVCSGYISGVVLPITGSVGAI
jgi:NAD(P)-dependent dehydrogenase (short-subunit alcohol dehydrogenase family)